MAYRIEQDITWQGMWENLHTFLTELTNIYDVTYESAQGDGVLSGLSVPADTATTETWTLICVDASYPQTFSVEGNLTGATANVIVDAPYNNGITYFTLTNGSTPWGFGDIISFSTETTITPPWKAVSPNVEPEGVITRFYRKSSGTYPDIEGEFMYVSDGPKSNSRATSAGLQNHDGDTSVCGKVEGNVSIEDNRELLNRDNWSVTYWARKNLGNWRDSFYYSEMFGQATSSLFTKFNYRGTFSAMNTNLNLRMSFRSTTYASSGINYDFPSADFYLDNPKDWEDWTLHCFTIEDTTLKAYLDTTLLGEYTTGNVSSMSYEIGMFMASGDVADLIVWNKVLTDQDRVDLISNPIVPELLTNPEVLDCITFLDEDIMPKIAVSNTDDNGNEVSAVFSPQNHPYFSYSLSMSFRGVPLYVEGGQEDLDFLHRDSDELKRVPGEYPCESYNYLLGAEPLHNISKYWFVASNEFIIVAYKTYDPTTQQQLPVYQIGYIGKGKTIEEQAYKTHFGMSSTGEDFWYTASSAFRSGLFYEDNATWLSQFYYDKPKLIGVAPIVDGLYDINNSYNVYPIIHFKAGGFPPAWSWLGVSNTYKTVGNQIFGEYQNLNGIQVLNVNHEDVVIIEGIRHIALGDATRAGSTSLILLKLD